MILISHRGNINGKNPERENSPEYIKEAIALSYDVEVDVWCKDEKLFLGHDCPQYEVDISFLKNDKLWCHCKNVEALRVLIENDVHCFYHKSDDATLTSTNIIWTFPRKLLVEDSVCVLPELGYDGDLSKCLGICSDFIEEYR
tara:strand:+ start:577 stop:1005 length:429 start_codon:yes stop_codon:yes gene_type:complete